MMTGLPVALPMFRMWREITSREEQTGAPFREVSRPAGRSSRIWTEGPKVDILTNAVMTGLPTRLAMILNYRRMHRSIPDSVGSRFFSLTPEQWCVHLNL